MATSAVVRATRGFVALLPALVAACGGDAVGETLAVRDSASVTIHENRIASARMCAMAPAPEVTIGVATGDPPYELYRVFDATVLADGKIAVVNQGSSEVRVYSATGEYLYAFGGDGQGPGEFQNVYQLWTLPTADGEQFIVGDYRPWSYSFFSIDGKFLKKVTPTPLYTNPPGSFGLLADGSYVLASDGVTSRDPAFQHVELNVLHHAPDGTLIDTIGTFPNGSRGRLNPVEQQVGFFGFPLFEAFTRFAAAGESIVIADGDTTQYVVRNPSGRIVQIVRWLDQDREVRAEHVDEWKRGMIEQAEQSDDPAQARSEMALDRPVNERLPALSAVAVSRVGEVLVRRFDRSESGTTPRGQSTTGQRWMIFETDGRLSCEIDLPPGYDRFGVFEFGRDYVLGRTTDELGVLRVELYRFERG
jgi:hypothetical protein